MMETLPLMLTIVAMGLVTFSLRLSLIVLAERVMIPPLIRRGLKYVPPAVFAAIIFPDVLLPAGRFDLSWSNPYLLSALVAIVAARVSKNVFVTMVCGMLVLWLVRGLAA